jgi:hypothetical protein
MHLRDGTDELLDDEGVEYVTPEAMRKAVLAAARDVICGDIVKGIFDLRYRIDAENAAGQILYTLPFQHAVSIIPPV